MIKLKPCPYCGCEIPHMDMSDIDKKVYVECPDCGLTAPSSDVYEGACSYWNEVVSAIEAYRNRTCRKVCTPTGGDDNPYACSVCGNDLTCTRVGEYCYECGARVVGE